MADRKIMRAFKMTEISSVDNPAQAHAKMTIMKRADIPDGETYEDYAKRTFTSDERKDLAASGKAKPDGSYPIVTTGDLRNAVRAWGRGGATASDKQHIVRRARSLGATSELPEDWKVGKASSSTEISDAEVIVAVGQACGLYAKLYGEKVIDFISKAAALRSSPPGKIWPHGLPRASAVSPQFGAHDSRAGKDADTEANASTEEGDNHTGGWKKKPPPNMPPSAETPKASVRNTPLPPAKDSGDKYGNAGSMSKIDAARRAAEHRKCIEEVPDRATAELHETLAETYEKFARS
jgi:hypothetical protein